MSELVLDLPTWVQTVLVIGTVATATVAVIRLAGHTTRGARAVQALIVRPVASDIVEVREQLSRIEDKVTPDDGPSLLARTYKLAEDVGEVNDRVEDLSGRVSVLQESFDAHVDTAELKESEIRRMLREQRGEA